MPREEGPGSNPGALWEGGGSSLLLLSRAGMIGSTWINKGNSESRCMKAFASVDCGLLSITRSSLGWEEIPGVLSMESVCPQQLLYPKDCVGLV